MSINPRIQIKLNGKVIQELEATRLGSEYTLKQILYMPTRTHSFGQPRLIVAGGYYAINTIAQSISVEKLKQLQAKIKKTQEALQHKNQTAINSLTREDIMGDMVYAASLSYYAQMIAQGKMAVRPLDAHFELVGSSGVIGYKPKIAKRFGLPTGLGAGGMSCDLIDAHMVEQGNNDDKKHIQANKQLGMIGSSLEHQVLEQLFATDTNAEGFSAVKAIQLANEQGQKIYTITQENYQEVIPQLQLAPDAIADIRGAAMAGLTVTTHQKRIHVNGYTGEGYIILNERGDGAYMINGGLYGGVMMVKTSERTLMMSSMLSFPSSQDIKDAFKRITVGILLTISVTYINDVDLPPRGLGLNTYAEAHLRAPITSILNDFKIALAGISSAIGFMGDSITTDMVFWYFYGDGMTLNLRDIGADKTFERSVRRFTIPYMRTTNQEASASGCLGYTKDDILEINILSTIFGIAGTNLEVSVSCDSNACQYRFKLRDWFKDVLDLNDKVDGNQEVEGGVPYEIHYEFSRTRSCQ